MTAKEKLLQEASQWNDAQATAALRVVKAHDELASHLDENATSADEREDSWAVANAREAIREERWGPEATSAGRGGSPSWVLTR